jgi:hypothetical protein
MVCVISDTNCGLRMNLMYMRFQMHCLRDDTTNLSLKANYYSAPHEQTSFS